VLLLLHLQQLGLHGVPNLFAALFDGHQLLPGLDQLVVLLSKARV
jgi:hypothetical protein